MEKADETDMGIRKENTQGKEGAFWEISNEDAAAMENTKPGKGMMNLDCSEWLSVGRQIASRGGMVGGPDGSRSQLHHNPPSSEAPKDQLVLSTQEGKDKEKLSINQPKGEGKVINSCKWVTTDSGRGNIGTSVLQIETDGSEHRRVEARDAQAHKWTSPNPIYMASSFSPLLP